MDIKWAEHFRKELVCPMQESTKERPLALQVGKDGQGERKGKEPLRGTISGSVPKNR